MRRVVSMPHSYNQDDRGEILGAYAVLEHRGGDPIVAYVDFDEYNQKQTTWKSYPRAMIIKVAENIVYKKFAGLTGIDAVENMPKQFLADANRKNTTEFQLVDSEIIDQKTKIFFYGFSFFSVVPFTENNTKTKKKGGKNYDNFRYIPRIRC